MQQKKTRRGREYLNDFRRDVNGSYLYQGSYRRYTGSMPYAKLRGLLWALCGGALAALGGGGAWCPAPGGHGTSFMYCCRMPWRWWLASARCGAGPHEPRRGHACAAMCMKKR